MGLEPAYERVVIVYNPVSAGGGPVNAIALKEELAAAAPYLRVDQKETQHPGHAEDIAYQAAVGPVLVVSASGDGGYHEVVNGVMRAVEEGHTGAVCAVLPSGNANDHARSVQRRPLAEAIVDGATTSLDLLRVEVDGRQVRYAHSYVGLGISPVTAIELNRHDPHVVKELALLARALWRYRPFTIVRGGEEMRLDSLVFANISQMAKYLTLSEDSSPRDGRYEIILIRHRGKPRLAISLIAAVAGRLPVVTQSRPYQLVTGEKMPLQLDGEVIHAEAGDQVTIRCVSAALRTVR